MRTQGFYRGGRLYGKPMYGRGVNNFLINSGQHYFGIVDDTEPLSEARVEDFLKRSDMDASVRKVSGAGNGLDNVIRRLRNLKVGNSRTKNIAFDF